MENFMNIAKKMLIKDLPHDGSFVNFTMKNGYDTLYMAQYISEGNIYAFAGNESNVENVYGLLENNYQDNVRVINDDIRNVKKYISGKINGFLFDAVKIPLDDEIVIDTLRIALEIMKSSAKGMLTLAKDRDKVYEFIKSLPQDRVNVLEMSMTNKNTPYIFIIEKIR